MSADAAEGSELTYLHGVAMTAASPTPEDLDAIEIPAGTWAVFLDRAPDFSTATCEPWLPVERAEP